LFDPDNKSFGLNLPKPAKLIISRRIGYQITHFKIKNYPKKYNAVHPFYSSKTSFMKSENSCKMSGKILAVSILLTGFALLSSFYISKSHKVVPKDRKVKVIVIDAGHGGKDPGCNGVNHKEKEVALAVALRLGKLIEEYVKDVKVIYTRKTDVFVELEDRAKIANDNNADLFISIHCNAAGKAVMIKDKKTGKMRAKTFKNSKGKTIVVETANPVPYGSETYVMGLKNEEGKMKVAQRENSVILMEDNYESKYQGFDPNSEESYIIMSNYTSGYVIQSAGFALKIQDEYSKRAGRVDKGVHRQSIWVLWRTSMPSVLTEIGYLTNPQEEKFLGSEKGQDYMAACLFRAFRKYKDEQEGIKRDYNDDIENQKNLDKEVHVPIKETEAVEAEGDEKKDTSTSSITGSKTDPKVEQSEKNYSEFIALADVSFKNRNFDDAKMLYEKALKARNGKDEYADKKLKEIAIAVARDQKEDDDRQKKEDEAEKNKVVDKNDIIKTYKEKVKKDTSTSSVSGVKTETPKVEPKTEPKTEVKPVVKAGAIEFKVQFASADKEVDAKSKFPNVKDVWFYKAGVVFKYTSGSFSSFEEATKHQAKLRELGYKDCFVAAFKNGQRMEINEAKKQAEAK
jgi:N-acetylmuramoyl-L-alanine amidase